LEARALHTLRLIARQPWRHCVTSLRSAHWLVSSLKLEARCPVSGCWPSCWKSYRQKVSWLLFMAHGVYSNFTYMSKAGCSRRWLIRWPIIQKR